MKPSIRVFSVVLSGVLLLGLTGCGEEEISPAKAAENNSRVRENMRAAQVAAEHYAADHDGEKYPKSIDDIYTSYFPGGDPGTRPAQVGPVNPYSGENQFPVLSDKVKDVTAVRTGKRFKVPPGQVEYCVLNNGSAYAIIGGAHDGLVLMDEKNPDQVLVFSNLP